MGLKLFRFKSYTSIVNAFDIFPDGLFCLEFYTIHNFFYVNHKYLEQGF